MSELNITDFSRMIEMSSVASNKPILDTILEYCEEHYLDVDEIIPYLNQTVIGKLESYFMSEGSLPKKQSIEDLL
jgi:hypothetical protein